jgi:hypothetical protein
LRRYALFLGRVCLVNFKLSNPDETSAEYVGRISRLLPNFPPDVLDQWCYRHQNQVHNWDQLDFPSLCFTEISISTVDIATFNLGSRGERVVKHNADVYRRHTQLPVSYRELKSYFNEHGTWPRPIIVLKSEEFNLGELAGIPYTLIEGHRRTALLRVRFEQQLFLCEHHKVWVISNAA